MFVMMFKRMYRAGHHLQYRQQIMLVILSFTLVPVIVAAVIAFPLYKKATMDRFIEVQTEQVKKSVDGVDRIYQNSIQKLVFLNNNQQLLQLLNQDYRTDLAAYIESNNQVNSVLRALESDQANSKVLVYGLKDKLYSSEYVKRADLLETSIVTQVKMLQENQILSRVTQDPDTGSYSLGLFGKITDLGQMVAITEMEVPFDTLYGLFKYAIDFHGFALYQSGSNVIPLSTNEGIPGDPMNDQSDYRIVAFTFNSNTDQILLFLNRQDMLEQFAALLVVPFLMIIALIFAIYFSVKAVSFLLTKRLSDLMKKMSKDISLSKEETLASLQIEDEFGIIDRRFQYLVHEIKEHYNHMSEAHIQKKMLEAELLQVHINPHFLYNTLSAIKWSFPDPRLSNIVDSLVIYYRIFLNKGQNMLTLQRELEMVRNYLEIQKFSYQSDFQYEIHVPPDMQQLPVIKNMIQPIVENAVLHGINGLEAGGRIRISAVHAHDEYKLIVEDNGVGISPEQLERMQSDTPAQQEEDANMPGGYGIYNARQRLALHYGDRSAIDIRSEPGTGTVVTLTIPGPS